MQQVCVLVWKETGLKGKMALTVLIFWISVYAVSSCTFTNKRLCIHFHLLFNFWQIYFLLGVVDWELSSKCLHWEDFLQQCNICSKLVSHLGRKPLMSSISQLCQILLLFVQSRNITSLLSWYSCLWASISIFIYIFLYQVSLSLYKFGGCSAYCYCFSECIRFIAVWWIIRLFICLSSDYLSLHLKVEW